MTLLLLVLSTVAQAGDQLAGMTIGGAVPVVTGWTTTSEGSLARRGKFAGLDGTVEVRTCTDNALVRAVTFSTDRDVFDALLDAHREDAWSASKGEALFPGTRSAILQKGGVTRTLTGNGSVTSITTRDDRVCR